MCIRLHKLFSKSVELSSQLRFIPAVFEDSIMACSNNDKRNYQRAEHYKQKRGESKRRGKEKSGEQMVRYAEKVGPDLIYLAAKPRGHRKAQRAANCFFPARAE